MRTRRVRRWLAVVVLLGIPAIVASAAAIPVTGTLQIPRGFSAPTAETGDRPAAYYWQERNGFLDTREERVHADREMTVVLLGDTEGDRPDSSMKLQGGNLMPSTMVVQAGSQLHIQNTDTCSHELFSDDIEGFSALQTAPGNARSHGAPGAAGHHVIRDRIYSHVRGHLHVVTNLAARATLGADGRFRFEDVPEGTYTLKVYFREREVASRQVEVAGPRDLALEEPVPITLPASQ